DSLLKHTIPGVSVGVLQVFALTGRPLGEQNRAGVFSAKERPQRSLKGATEEHCCPGILLLPPIQIAMPIAPRAGEVLADLGVTVRHEATCGLSRFAGESSSQRPAGAKPSSRSREVSLRTIWLILTTPFSF